MTSLEVEQHLRTCAACALSHENYRTLRAGFLDEGLYFSAPASLQTRILSLGRPASASNVLTFAPTPWRWWGMAATLTLVALLSWNLIHTRSMMRGDDFLAQEVVASHVRSLMVGHLADVASTDQHTVKPWFSGKLDYAPPVKNLASQGYPLIGGRLDDLDGRPVAALVYRRQKHFINLFVWPDKTENGKSNTEAITSQGYHIVHWDKAGMTYWAISDLNGGELSRFGQFIQANAD